MKILEWREMCRNSLLGFYKIEMPSGLQISDVCILAGERGPWASPPSKPQIDRDGNVLREPTGKVKYTPIISFASKELRDKWSGAVLKALSVAHPEVLAGTAPANPSPPSAPAQTRWPAMPGPKREPAPPLADDPLPF